MSAMDIIQTNQRPEARLTTRRRGALIIVAGYAVSLCIVAISATLWGLPTLLLSAFVWLGGGVISTALALIVNADLPLFKEGAAHPIAAQ